MQDPMNIYFLQFHLKAVVKVKHHFWLMGT